MAEETSRSDAARFLHELADRADAIVGTHIRGVTLGHDDLRKLANAVRLLVGEGSEETVREAR